MSFNWSGVGKISLNLSRLCTMAGDIPSNPESVLVMRVKSLLGLCRPLLLVKLRCKRSAHLEGPYGVIRSRLDRIAETIRPERRGACSESRASGGTLNKTIISVAVEWHPPTPSSGPPGMPA